MNSLLKITLLAMLPLAIVGCSEEENEPVADVIPSAFDNDADGWTIVGDAQGGSNLEASYSPFKGLDDSGYIYADDDVAGGVWYFSAPSKYLGNRSAFLGGELSFWLIQDSRMNNQFEARDVVIGGNGTEISLRFESFPALTWTKYSIKLDASEGWLNESDQAATSAELTAVLGNMTSLLIRGEYQTGPDTGGLDQFEMKRQ